MKLRAEKARPGPVQSAASDDSHSLLHVLNEATGGTVVNIQVEEPGRVEAAWQHPPGMSHTGSGSERETSDLEAPDVIRM